MKSSAYMVDVILPSDAFSHSQIKSKRWLAENFNLWSQQHLRYNLPYTLNWYGSWVGVGPLILLLSSRIRIDRVNLYDLDKEKLESSRHLLDYWRCDSVKINAFAVDINSIVPSPGLDQIFINTSCEHIPEMDWIKKIPANCFVILQSTDMPHLEHINCHTSTEHFSQCYSEYIDIIETKSISFSYPDKTFSRYMLFGRKK